HSCGLYGGGISAGNSIVADNFNTSNMASRNCTSGVASNGGNITDTSIADCAGFTEANDQLSTDPMISALADNGGYTWTHALQNGSPAIDSGDNALCPATDQRGESRPVNGTCDIGAVER